ncbi:MAG: UbiA-like polyprenyltransferase [Planctomycetota bacterium]
MSKIRHLLEMIRFSHTVFALPFALSAAVMAWFSPVPESITLSFGWRQWLGILLCMAAARSAAMAYNRLVDRDIDASNPRTKNRHLPAGLLTPAGVTLFIILSAAIFVGGTLLFWPNRLPLFLSIPILVFLCGYSHAKRFTSLAHFWLGVALMLAPISAWIALRGEVVQQTPSDLLPAVCLGLAVFFWVAGFDIIYACQDQAFDVQQQLRSVPARLGVPQALKVARACHGAMLGTLFALPRVAPHLPLSWIYYCGVAVVALLLLYEHALVKPTDLSRVNLAFFHVNAVVSIGLFCVVSLDLYW